MTTIKEDLERNCKSIAEDLIAYAKGEKVYSETEGDFVNAGDYEDDGLYAYLSDVLDIDLIVSLSDKSYRGAEITVACGGPTIWIDTRDSMVYGSWGADKADAPITGRASEMLDDVVREYWEEVM